MTIDKILIIGQAPPYQKQTLPYDTTMLYDILKWVGIDKEEAQGLFDFDALIDKFPGFDHRGNHLKPSLEDKQKYFNEVLEKKIFLAKKVILLGNEAKDFIQPNIKRYEIEGKFLFLPHPSYRNAAMINKDKTLIINALKQFLAK